MKLFRMLVGLLMLATAQMALAQAKWPSQPIRFIVPYSAGGSSDALARAIGQHIAKELGQPVVVENRPGASGSIGASACKTASPDGHTFCVFLMEVLTTNPAIFKNLSYTADDFAPVAFLGEVNALIVAPYNSPINSLRDLAAASKARPDAINWGSWGVGSTAHLVLGAINNAFSSNITHVPYVNTPGLVTATLTGEVNATVLATALAEQHVNGKALKPIAVIGEKRLPQYPNVPTVKEQGLDLDGATWFGMFAPAGISKATAATMHDTVARAMATPAVVKTMEAMGVTMRPMSQAELATLLKRDSAVWQSIARRASISLD